jgi:endonuclease G
LNRNAWNQEEIYLRTLAVNGQRLYIIAGPTGSGGVGAHGPATSIAGGQVAVPAACWKIAVIVPDQGKDDPAQITAETRVIAVLMPNDTSLGFEWGQYRTSVAAIEKLTGFKFFTALPPAVANALKQKVDAEKLPPPVEPEWHKRIASTPKKGSDVQ